MSDLKASNTTENLKGVPTHEQTILEQKQERFQAMLEESSPEFVPVVSPEDAEAMWPLAPGPIRTSDDSGSVAHESISAVEEMANIEEIKSAFLDGRTPSPEYRIHQLEDRVTELEARLAKYNAGAPHKI